MLVTNILFKMNTNSKFIVATHILVLLAVKKEYFGVECSTSSELLTESVNTNPVVIRRILGVLNKAGIIHSKSGPKGGSVLAHQPRDITLDMIYHAFENDGSLFHFHYQQPNYSCPVGANIKSALSAIISPLNKLLSEYLSKITLQEIMDDTFRRSGILKYLDAGKTPIEIEKMISSGRIKLKTN